MFDITHQRRLIALGHHLTSRQYNSFGGNIRFQTTLVTTATVTTAIDDTGMAHFASEALNALVIASVAEEATA